MYSVVLMMAMTAGGEAPEGLFHKDCCSCSCSCSSYTYSCCGCCSYSSCHGCCSYSSCCCSYSSCHGCCSYSSCCCSSSCHGGFFSKHHKSCCSSSCCCSYSSCCGYTTCCGCCGYGAPVYAPGAPAAPTFTPAPVGPAAPVGPKPEEIKKDPAPAKGAIVVPAPATIVVTLPADAKLTIDGIAMTSTSAVRTFVSPTLNPGKEFHYTMKVEFVQDGKTIEQSKIVSVTAGNETTVSFEAPVAAGVVSR